MSPDELARVATRVGASRPSVFQVKRSTTLTLEVVITCGGAEYDMLGRARDVEMLLTHTEELVRALSRPDDEARAMERAVKIISGIVNGQKPYNESEIEVEVLRIFGRAE